MTIEPTAIRHAKEVQAIAEALGATAPTHRHIIHRANTLTARVAELEAALRLAVKWIPDGCIDLGEATIITDALNREDL